MRYKQMALKPMIYGGQRLKAGDEFMATRRDMRILQKIGKAGDPPPEPQKRGPGRPRKEQPVEQVVEQVVDTKALEQAAEAPATDAPATSYEDRASAASEAYERRYGRRDMEAED